MDVNMWDIKKQTWVRKTNIKRIYISTAFDYFKLDGKKYKTSEYDLQFIHAGVFK